MRQRAGRERDKGPATRTGARVRCLRRCHLRRHLRKSAACNAAMLQRCVLLGACARAERTPQRERVEKR